MKSQYSKEFKIEAVKRVLANNGAITKVAEELGLKTTTLQGWVTKNKLAPEAPFPGSGHLSPANEVTPKTREGKSRAQRGE